MIQWASTPASLKAVCCRPPDESSPIFPPYRVFSPQDEHAEIALATWPPASTSDTRNSTLELNEGKCGSLITVSVAFRPTPTTSTIEREFDTQLLYGKIQQPQ